MSKKEVPVHVKVLIVIISVFAVISIIFSGVLIYDNFIYNEPKKGAILEVEEVYFVYEGAYDGEYSFSVKAFISNVGDEDCSVKIRAFAIDEQSNLAMDDAETIVGVVKTDTTVETSFEITVIYQGTFTVEIMVFKDDMITVKGNGKVSLSDTQAGGKDYQDTMIDEEKDLDDGRSLPFPPTGVIIVAVVAASLLFCRVAKRRWRR